MVRGKKAWREWAGRREGGGLRVWWQRFQGAGSLRGAPQGAEKFDGLQRATVGGARGSAHRWSSGRLGAATSGYIYIIILLGSVREL